MLLTRSRSGAWIILLGILAVALAGTAAAQGTGVCAENGVGPSAGSDGYYEYKNVFWGDLHVHTSWSFDAVTIGTRTTPDDSYKFAKGEPIGLPPYEMVDGVAVPTRSVELSRSLDFLAVTDHSEYLGEVRICAPCLPGESTPQGGECSYEPSDPTFTYPLACKALQVSIPVPGEPAVDCSGGGSEVDSGCLGNLGFALWGLNFIVPDPVRFPFCNVQGGDGTWGTVCGPPTSNVWAEYVGAAERNNDPCSFTTLVGYEWTAMPGGKNHHRNVIFANINVPPRPFSVFETHGTDPTRLWARLDDECVNSSELNSGAGPDCDALAIPHNSNLGGGNILPVTSPGSPERALQITYEPLIEIHQTKGNSECRYGVGNTDEDCQFELQTKKLLFGPAAYAGPLSADQTTLLSAAQQGYEANSATGGTYNNFVREFLKAGLYLGAQSGGSNPYKLGVVGATDTHNSTAGSVDEVNYEGQHGIEDDTRDRRLSRGQPSHGFLEANPGAVTAVWAPENTRDGIFNGLKAKETYGTSGIRPVVRFFGGWTYDSGAMCEGGANFEQVGYGAGVPMGSTLGPRPAGSTSGPRFAIKIIKDPEVDAKTRIERVQVIRGFIDDNGKPAEEVVAVLGPDKPPNHSLYVDPTTCALRDGGGQDTVCLVWEDTDFQPDQAAFYYLRVLQTPTCRWSTLQCLEYATQEERNECLSWISQPAMKEDSQMGLVSGVVVEKTIQERAWTSPIWYDPPAQP